MLSFVENKNGSCTISCPVLTNLIQFNIRSCWENTIVSGMYNFTAQYFGP